VDDTTVRFERQAMSGAMPQQFGKYELIQRIGTGGMAEIFKAKVTGEGGFEKLVAIKRILPHLSDNAEFLAMLMREAKLAALLSHPNIVQIYDFGKEENTYYIAMEYLWGNDLRTILNRAKDRHPLPLECALYIASRICAGLEYSHNLRDLQGNSLNIIHRDVNPQNIIVTNQGEVKIVDFGIAKIEEMDSTTKVGALKGKVAYMSPEQAAGQVIDKRSDIFSTGVILYEMITGGKAFPGTTMAVLERVRKAEFKAPELVVPDLPAEVYEILHKALAKNPDQRFQTCADMLRRLDDCLTMFSERQNTENLSRQIRHLFVDEHLDTKSQEAGFIYPSAPAVAVAGVGRAERTQTLMIDPAAPAAETASSPARRVVGLGLGLWFAGTVAVALAVFFYYKMADNPKPEQPSLAPMSQARTVVPPEEYQPPGTSFQGSMGRGVDSTPRTVDSNATAILRQGLELVGRDPEGARKLLVRSVEVNPSNVEGYFELGKLCSRLGDHHEAMKSYQKVIELEPGHSRALFNLGLLYAQRENFVWGEILFSRVIALSPDFLDEAYFNLAMMQQKQGKVKETIRSLELALLANPRNAKAAAHLNQLKAEQ
jgi:tetratricopeptide (TPR) repeat protein/tRNA A-37 threonylcarbamoyl transferase component Bud32